jgi:ribosomal protein S24E
MPPVNDVGPHEDGCNDENEGPRKFTFPSHQFHMVHLAKMCQENKDYTDCVIRVGEDELRAHRLVLGSVSPFLKLVFSDLPANHTEATILVPGVCKRVVKNLLDFFYTGQMTVDRQDTSDLQLLIDTLQIDPGLITVDAVEAKDGKKTSEETDSTSESSSSSRKRKKSHSVTDNDNEQASEASEAKAKKLDLDTESDDASK